MKADESRRTIQRSDLSTNTATPSGAKIRLYAREHPLEKERGFGGLRAGP
jgi:hypothetical protein